MSSIIIKIIIFLPQIIVLLILILWIIIKIILFRTQIILFLILILSMIIKIIIFVPQIIIFLILILWTIIEILIFIIQIIVFLILIPSIIIKFTVRVYVDSDAALCYGGSEFTVRGYVDSDFAGDLEKRKSTTGYVFIIAGGAVSWVSKLQTVVALSTTKAEYMAATQACK